MAKHRNGDDYEISGINVTPLVDIMMVLLISVTATYIVKEAIRIELPRAAATEQAVPTTLKISIAKGGQTYVDRVPADDAAIVRRVAGGAPVDARRAGWGSLPTATRATAPSCTCWIC